MALAELPSVDFKASDAPVSTTVSKKGKRQTSMIVDRLWVAARYPVNRRCLEDGHLTSLTVSGPISIPLFSPLYLQPVVSLDYTPSGISASTAKLPTTETKLFLRYML
ncbi:hypothetical protein PQX77_020419 [Marasmius sp. AFHP31]|nr:hypothetical protein PQX77_020419 [Marasmius sp. AFHP31]